MHRVLIVLLLILTMPHLQGNECGLEVRLLQSINNVVPGCVTSIQAEIINRSSHRQLLVGHLDLPSRWEAVPSNDILMHLDVGQCAIQTLMIRVPESGSEGEYPIAYEVWARNNRNFFDRDTGAIVIGAPSESLPISVEITSPPLCEPTLGELFFVSALIVNRSDQPFDGNLLLNTPPGWHSFPGESVALALEPEESKVLMYGVKVPGAALAGEHRITLGLEGSPHLCSSVVACIKPKVDVQGFVDGGSDVFNISQQAQFFVRYTNNGNVPLRVVVETFAQPACRIECAGGPFEILPHETYEVPIALAPEFCLLQEFSQFLLVKLVDVDTGEQLYQNPMTLKFVVPSSSTDDQFVRVPARFRMMALGDRYKNVLAAEYAGGGLIDAEKERYCEFFLRMPTDSHYVIYNIDQCLYAGMNDQDWNVQLGDTVYTLSDLTQRYRYGRGANVERYWDNWSAGVHYTENTLKSECNPRELCSYVEWRPVDNWGISGNYLHKVEGGIPTSNIITLQSDLELPRNIVAEVEGGTNCVERRHQRDNNAYRLALSGKMWKDSWFSVEKIYAGPEFYGYYNHLHLFSAALDMPLCRRLRLNANINHFVQNFDLCSEDPSDAIIPRQRQYCGSLTYSMTPGCSFAVNGMLLRGQDLGECPQYDFYQKWLGGSFFLTSRGYSLNGIATWGQQKDYRHHHHKTIHSLQRYYVYLSKDFSAKLSASLFYEGGNTNYYDARPWRTAYGGALYYRFAPTGCMELFMQKVKQSSDMLDMSQITFNFNYTYKNQHTLQASAQYSNYRSHYPNDMMFLVSYSIPFSMPICRRQDVGNVGGIIYNAWDKCAVSGAMMECAKDHVATGADGRFMFINIPRGEHSPRLELLPDDLITLNNGGISVDVIGGKTTELSIPVVPACSIGGEVVLYGYKDLFALLVDPSNAELIAQEGIKGMRVGISLDGQQEVYIGTTNDRGVFTFPKLRPGNWHIKLFTEELTELQELDINNLVVDVKPGENKFIAFKVTPKAPEIHLLE